MSRREDFAPLFAWTILAASIAIVGACGDDLEPTAILAEGPAPAPTNATLASGAEDAASWGEAVNLGPGVNSAADERDAEPFPMRAE